MISRNYTWIDQRIEHDELEAARAASLARKWSELKTRQEERQFKRQADIEDYGFTGPEPCEECERCIAGEFDQCVGIVDFEKKRSAIHDDENMEIEIVERMLDEMGARMMRPYEHWNEDELMMEYMENRYEEGR
jgi:hypothetical protein